MDWWNALGKDNRGSRPRCVMLVDGSRKEVAERLTKEVINHPGVFVSPEDMWMPYGKPAYENGIPDKTPAKEAMLDKPNCLIPPEIQTKLRDWWLEVPRRARTPNWDIASACSIEGKRGILLVEAKAHRGELDRSGKSRPATENSRKNHEKIEQAIEQASTAFGDTWNLSSGSHYQLSNRFAWSWKLASLGVPVALVYLGFLNAYDMANKDQDGIFESEDDWKETLIEHCESVVDQSCWGERMDVSGTPLIPLIRAFDFE